MRVFGILLSALLLAGCATTVARVRPQPVHLADVQLDPTPLVEALLARRGTLVQALNGSWRDRAFQAQCVMKGDGERLTVVLLAPQVRLATITVERPHVVSCEFAPQIPRSFEPEYALTDLAFVNLGTDDLRRVLAPAFRVEETGVLRRILTARGAPVAEVEHLADGNIAFRNLQHGYSYILRTVGE